MLSIRMSRIGKKKKPMYRIVIAEKTKDPFGDSMEILGNYNPFTKELSVKKERIEHWIKNGAQMTPTVNNLLISKEIIKGEKVTASRTGKGKPKPAEYKKPEVPAPAEEAKAE